MKKNTLVIAAVACAGLALSACQQKVTEENKDKAATPAVETQPVAPATDSTQPATPGHSMNEHDHNMNLAADTQMPSQANDAANPAVDPAATTNTTTSASTPCPENDAKCIEEQKASTSATTSTTTTPQQ